MCLHRVMYKALLPALVVFLGTATPAFPQSEAVGASHAPEGAVEVTILLDASTSMKPAWDQCRTHLPVLLEGLRPGDRLQLIVFGRAQDLRTVFDREIVDSADLASVEDMLAEIECDLRGSIMSVGFDKALALWGGSGVPKVFIVVTDGIVWPPSGPAHDAEWAARWDSARSIRQDPSIHRVIFGVRTKEPGAKSLRQLETVLLPQQVLMLGEDDLAEFLAGLDDLRRVVEQARVPPSGPSVPVANVPPEPRGRRSAWPLFGGLLLAAAVAARAVRAARRHALSASAGHEEPVAGTLSVEAWMLDDNYQRAGDPVKWEFDVPVRGVRELLIGGPGHAQADCQVEGVELLAPEPPVLEADRGGIRALLIPSFESVLVKDDVPGFNPDARCLDETLYRRLDAGAEPRLCPVRGLSVLIRVLPGRNELDVCFEAPGAPQVTRQS